MVLKAFKGEKDYLGLDDSDKAARKKWLWGWSLKEAEKITLGGDEGWKRAFRKRMKEAKRQKGGGELAELSRTDCRPEEEFKVEIMENQEFRVRSLTWSEKPGKEFLVGITSLELIIYSIASCVIPSLGNFKSLGNINLCLSLWFFSVSPVHWLVHWNSLNVW